MAADEDGHSKWTLARWALGVALVLAGVGGFTMGVRGFLGGLFWLLTGLLLFHAVRDRAFNSVAARGGPDLTSAGVVTVSLLLIGGFVAGGAIMPETTDAKATDLEATPTPTASPTPSKTTLDQTTESTTSGTNTPAQTSTQAPTERPPTPTPASTPPSTSMPTPTPTPTPTPKSTPMPTHTQTSTATPTPTSTPSPTPTPTPTPRPTPTATPTPTPEPAPQTEYTVTITDVVDGDTMDIQYQNGSTDTVRLLGVDTPEVHTSVDPAEFDVPDTQDGHSWLSRWGEKASSFATQQVAGETVRIVIDEQADRRGSYDRLLVYLYDDGEMLNRQLLEEGYARVYPSSFSKRDGFEEVERRAKSTKTGIWGYTPSSDSSDTTGALSVARIHADAPGNDHDNLNEEYIVFENTGDSSLELGGWTVCDIADHCYTIPSDFELAAGQTVTLYTGSGTNSDTSLYWESGSAIWNNSGDTIIVMSSAGETRLEEEYS